MDAEKVALTNKHCRLLAISELDKLLDVACDPAFRGTIGVEISVKDGRLAEPKTTLVRFGTGD